MASDHQPRFIVIEGLDGSGTTTQAGLIAEALKARDLPVLVTAEPSDGPVGALLRAHLRGEITLGPQAAALTFTADRADHLERVIRPALRDGYQVICDRYLLSTLAYQGTEGVSRQAILDASEGFDVPDVTVYLDPPEVDRATRLDARERRERYETPELADSLRASYEASIALLRAHGHRIEVVTEPGRPSDVLGAVLLAIDAE